jgi:(R,R)-butanediol dehydrogenase/meso-butanediol dehydrogenase/diacetyl reductase
VRAAVYHGQRDVRVEDVAEPAPPRAGELLLEVGHAAICGTDASEFLHGPRFVPLTRPHPGSGHLGPIVLGHEFAGRVAAVGVDVERFEPGQRVACGAGVSCGSCAWCRAGRTNLCERYYTIGLHANGGLGERVLVPASACELVPDSCSDRAAALAQPLAVALHARDRARVVPGQSVAVIGVGGIGSLIVVALRAAEASPVIAVDVDPERLETAGRLGAHHALDARAQALPAILDLTGGVGADVAVEATGTEDGLAQAVAAVRRGGRILLVGQHYEGRLVDLLDLTLRELDVTATLAHVCRENLPEALRLLGSGDLGDRIVGRVVELEHVVAEGLEPLAEGRARGKIVVRVGAPALA